MSVYDQNNQPQELGDVQAAVAVGAAMGEVREVERPKSPDGLCDGLYAVVPKGYRLESLEQFLAKPARLRQHVTLDDEASFTSYVKTFGIETSTRLFFQKAVETFVAVIDYHVADANHPGGPWPSWCEHVAQFACKRSAEFLAWMEKNRKQMTQVDFARFLEENLPDIVEPPSAEMLEIALGFQAHKQVAFSSGVRLSNGQIQFQYDEVVRGETKKGQLEVPETFFLGIPVHENGPAYRIEVRLRWRLQEGSVVFWYEIVRPQRVIDDAVKEIGAKIAADSGYEIWAGSV